MSLFGWLLAYWGIWVILGSFLLMVRYKGWSEEWHGVRDLSLWEKMVAAYGFLEAVTFWPREYRDQGIIEEMEDDDDDDDDKGPKQPQKKRGTGRPS